MFLTFYSYRLKWTFLVGCFGKSSKWKSRFLGCSSLMFLGCRSLMFLGCSSLMFLGSTESFYLLYGSLGSLVLLLSFYLLIIANNYSIYWWSKVDLFESGSAEGLKDWILGSGNFEEVFGSAKEEGVVNGEERGFWGKRGSFVEPTSDLSFWVFSWQSVGCC